ncbi:MAG: hypothetical protein FWE44_05030 [Defluviitaleaceae bacterium]|nr:hypothetical protein [Defluviitaleaceae bacterium]
MKIFKQELCDKCLQIRPTMADGSQGISVEGLLDSDGYNKYLGFVAINFIILTYLDEEGGCPNCIEVFKRVT